MTKQIWMDKKKGEQWIENGVFTKKKKNICFQQEEEERDFKRSKRIK